MSKEERKYGVEELEKLEGLDAIRHRPGMYIGGTGPDGLQHLITEIVSNSLDEASNGYGDTIIVTMHEDKSISIRDYGRGMPIGMHPKYKQESLELLMGSMHFGGKMDADTAYKYSAGLHGLGTKIVNALSDWVEVTVWRDGKKHFLRYENAVKLEDLRVIETISDKASLMEKRLYTGTLVRFKPSKKIFPEPEFDYNKVINYCKKMAYLNSHVTFKVIHEKNKKEEVFKFTDGVSGMCAEMAGASNLLPKIIRLKGTAPCVLKNGRTSEYFVEVAFTFNSSSNDIVSTYVNSAPTPDGGTHLSGFRTALTKSINDVARSLGRLKDKDSNLSANEIRSGLVLVINAKVPEPEFEGQTKSKLNNTDIQGLTQSIMNEQLKHYLDDYPKITNIIIDKVIQNRKIIESMKKYKDSLLKPSTKSQNLSDKSGKLAQCTSKKAEECELFIVEGDSAGGSAKSGRNALTQAILPLRGKPKNTEGESLDAILKNEEFKSLILSIGAGFGDEFNIEKIRYKKIIILADADVDKIICRL